MALDPARATFVQRDFRYETAVDNTVLATFPNAREVEIPANIDQASAAAMASSILAATKTPAIKMTTSVDQLFYLDDLDGLPPMFALTADSYQVANRTGRLQRMTIDWITGVTSVETMG